MKLKYALLALLLAFSFQSSAALVTAESYLADQGQNYLQRLSNIVNRLNDDFNLVCNDSYCHGIYDLFKPLSIQCFVESTSGTVEYCVWAIAKSRSWVAGNGKVSNDGQIYFCEFLPKMTIQQMIDKIEFTRAPGQTPYLSVILPGVEQSLAQSLARCLK